MDYRFEEVQKLKFSVYDVDNESPTLDDDDFLGSIECTLGEVGVACEIILYSIMPVPPLDSECGHIHQTTAREDSGEQERCRDHHSEWCSVIRRPR